MNEFNRKYAEILGVEVTERQFDNGVFVTLEHRGEQSSAKWSGMMVHGESEKFNRRVMKWLHTLPWPREDDPRVATEGVYA